MALLVFVPVGEVPAAALADPAWVACHLAPFAPEVVHPAGDHPFPIGSASAELPVRHLAHHLHEDEEACIPAEACSLAEDLRGPAAPVEDPAAAVVVEDILLAGSVPAEVRRVAAEDTQAEVRLVHPALPAVGLHIERADSRPVLAGWDHCPVRRWIL